MTSIANQSPTPGCFPTDTPSDVDIAALREKYRAERDKRLSADGFPNLFFTGFSQGGVAASNTAMYEQQGEHIAYIISEALVRGFASVEPTQDPRDDWCGLVKETAVPNADFERSCTPGYYNNEAGGGGEGIRSHLGEPYGPGFYAFGELLAQWRANGNMEGMQLRS